MKDFKDKVLASKEMLCAVNEHRAKLLWEEVAKGSISKWEMDSLSFYYHEHELAHINMDKYDIHDFEEMSTEPVVAEYRTFRNKEIPRFALTRICGTVLDRDKNKHIVTLLTPTGVVSVKFYKGQFNFYDKQISEVDETTGKKTVLEKSWFSRGNKLLVTGYRREDQFIPKKYKDSIYQHSLQLIVDIEEDELKLQTDRIGEEDETNGIW
jgi:DNA polymerase-3 subunit alpha